MTEQEKKIAFVKRAAAMAGVETTNQSIWLTAEFWLDDLLFAARADITDESFGCGLVITGNFRGAADFDIFPAFQARTLMRGILRIALEVARAEYSRQIISFRALTFLTALFSYDPDHESDSIPT